MRDMLDASWRAAAYCWHPLALLWGLLPLALAGGGVFGFERIGWEPALATAKGVLEHNELLGALFEWLQDLGAPNLRPLLAPMLVLALIVPVVVLATLLLVTWLLSPSMVRLVARRRFPDLRADPGAPGGWGTSAWALLCALAAAAALVVGMPLWLLPPLVLVLPPLVWGWLCYRVFAFEALAWHAGTAERRYLLHRHRWALRLAALLFGILCALPMLLGAVGALGTAGTMHEGLHESLPRSLQLALLAALAPPLPTSLLAPLLVWLYTIVFAFATLLFTHFLLAALERLRRDLAPPAPETESPSTP